MTILPKAVAVLSVVRRRDLAKDLLDTVNQSELILKALMQAPKPKVGALGNPLKA